MWNPNADITNVNEPMFVDRKQAFKRHILESKVINANNELKLADMKLAVKVVAETTIGFVAGFGLAKFLIGK